MKRVVALLLALFIGGTIGCVLPGVELDSEGVYRTGYPGNIGGAKVAVTCQGSLARRDPIANSPDPIAFGCNMLGGSSGGPVIFKYAPTFSGSRNFVNGVNSYGYTGQPNGMYFSYFGTGAKNLYDVSKTQ